jgi:hypothetical protein
MHVNGGGAFQEVFFLTVFLAEDLAGFCRFFAFLALVLLREIRPLFGVGGDYS